MLRVICKSDLRLKSDLSDWKKESVEPFSNYRFWGVTMSFRFNLQLNQKSLRSKRCLQIEPQMARNIKKLRKEENLTLTLRFEEFLKK